MAVNRPRLVPRRTCRGGVLVRRLSGGPSLKGTLADLRMSGARLMLDHPLGSGEVVRLVFPARSGQANRQGHMILGQVVHTQPEPGGYAVGVAFGWDAVIHEIVEQDKQKLGFLDWFRSFWKKNPAPPATRSQQ